MRNDAIVVSYSTFTSSALVLLNHALELRAAGLNDAAARYFEARSEILAILDLLTPDPVRGLEFDDLGSGKFLFGAPSDASSVSTVSV